MAGALMSICGTTGAAGSASFTVTVSPSSVSGTKVGPGTVTTSVSSVASVTGGVPPYTYLWNEVTPDAGGAVITPTASTSSSTKFSSFLGVETSALATWRCTVTDDDGSVANSSGFTIVLSTT